MEFALTPSGLVYNLPALLVLTYLLVKRPVEGVVLVFFVVLRMMGHWPVSMHATIATFAVVSYGPRLVGRAAGLALFAFTAFYYYEVFVAAPAFWRGVVFAFQLAVVQYSLVGVRILWVRKRRNGGEQKTGAFG